MNRFWKFVIAILGGINIAFSIFIPVAVALLLVNQGILDDTFSSIVIIAGAIATLYRGIDVGILRFK